MTFPYNGKPCVLKSTLPDKCKMVKNMDGLLEQGSQMFLLQAVDEVGEPRIELHRNGNEDGSSVHTILKFSDVFAEPKTLPPYREGHNHSIVLKEGPDPVNVRPYRYPAIQKNEIERQVKDLLEAGVI